ncbi:hypothetical protein [Streptomyces parvulus]|uniref:Uncharacterized protein n=1 Tax=Streptomyces parvulus TaxID=146923 RepID=A0A369VB79_9ACTN|nr:hypothetical protein [Streptomyces parvulus]RDD90336.1 hypothetical protein DVZ84_02950 [Streptomyces parvulus]
MLDAVDLDDPAGPMVHQQQEAPYTINELGGTSRLARQRMAATLTPQRVDQLSATGMRWA